MTDTYTWIKGLPDIIRSYALLIVSMLAVIGSSTGGYQYFDKQNVIEEKNQDIREVATAFQSELAEKTEKPQTRNATCGTCAILINKHKKELH